MSNLFDIPVIDQKPAAPVAPVVPEPQTGSALKHFSRDAVARAQNTFVGERAKQGSMRRPMDESPIVAGWGGGK